MTEDEQLPLSASASQRAHAGDDRIYVTPDRIKHADRDSGKAVIATCRSNVLEWLAAGLITPRRGFDKYYEDSLAVREDVVPVVRAPVGTELLEVERANLGNFPVLVEVDEDKVRWLGSTDVGYMSATPLSAARA